MNLESKRAQTNTVTSLDLLNNGTLVPLVTAVLLVMEHSPYTQFLPEPDRKESNIKRTF
jgi:hypothetical protein